ncbi:uncharacterized protein LOC120708590 [Panicum virgatum]|uniref:Uncharacterized protein n=1 Tax=Panicum virgatum TaxID=38727 RepID=A0A8T0SXC7_PANVG|nr:uncharacterized protein LOC120708590 [Panicum virgatum]XP_039849877.1 uncharacterized protein LOC120708590 [Panicum virgatum]XP_039849878.1 uncharacterized protein LOC120708590 [Panicum virgatum]XP_039849879.1 uncharacterized protein LOC120708590 [Panicum virgatum]XP_039849880.1 uncharacterized protein LOC120708590 [Panicum virgatum]KAG2601774.1 hypothetical protein PVAP13_5KG617900 [Panicum virgatum]
MDGGSSSPASYIRLVQHLIEKCICYNMNKEECMETLEKHAKIMPVITSTVWKELEKENREFFETYKKDRGEDSTRENPPPPDGGGSASSKSSADDDDQTADQ